MPRRSRRAARLASVIRPSELATTIPSASRSMMTASRSRSALVLSGRVTDVLAEPFAGRAETIGQAIDLAAERLQLVSGPDIQAMLGVDGGDQLGAVPEILDGPDERVANAAGDHESGSPSWRQGR